ncbi:nitrate/nitrite transporter [Ferrovibrio sp.]|uniref:MFS transporter n=1 Tax=Ferrovibrio sp. TaxID=1917215 RepID=UPI001B3D2E46|nr:MFS transporter [Ferrovibrio sp.]MBP7065856.1 MFS transporter [Ferrovibrio sp.]
MSRNQSLAFIAGRVLLPFACGYFLSYLFRSVNAVIAPNLQRDLNIGAGDLGTLTAVYFTVFALAQLPLGVLLDRYGPRRVQAGLLLFAALGAVIFATGTQLWHLMLGRTLIGLGVAGCLMSAFKTISLWVPAERWALANGVFMTAGGLGALAATLPVEWLLHHLDWTAIFWLLAALVIATSAAVYFVVPEKPGQPVSRDSLTRQMRECLSYLADRRFWQITPVTMFAMSSALSIQGLWSGPYLRDVGGLDRQQAAELQFLLAAALTFGFAIIGIATDRLQKIGISMRATLAASTLLYAVVLLVLAAGWAPTHPLTWIAFGLLSNTTALAYPMLSGQFPPQATGRINTLLNGVVFGFTFFAQAGLGWIINRWPRDAAGGYPAEAYSWAFGLPLVLILISMAWYLRPARPVSA